MEKIFFAGVTTWTVQWISWCHIFQKSWCVHLFSIVLHFLTYFITCAEKIPRGSKYAPYQKDAGGCGVLWGGILTCPKISGNLFSGSGTSQQPPVQPVPGPTTRDFTLHPQGGCCLSRPCLQCLQRWCDWTETVDKRPGERSLSKAGGGTLEIGSISEAKFERMLLISFVEINCTSIET